MCDLTNPIFTYPDKAREHLEKLHWPDGPICRHCGNADSSRITKLEGNSTRPGVYKCNECEKPFSVTVGTAMERSKIPLNKWLLVMHLMMSSKKGVSAHQIHRMLGLTYQTAWFMCHRLREGMRDMTKTATGGLGGAGKVVEADETYIGGKAKNRAYKPEPKKHIVMSLVERGGEVRSFHIKNATAKTLRETAVKIANRKSYLMTDENAAYTKLGKEFSGHGTVNHSANDMCAWVASYTSTAPKTIFPFSSVASMARSTTSASNILTAILRNLIFAIRTVPALELKMPPALRKR